MIVTTSRYASKKTRSAAIEFAKKQKSFYVARGKKTIAQLVEFAWRKGEEKIAIVRERKGTSAVVDEIEIDQWGKWKWGKSYEIPCNTYG